MGLINCTLLIRTFPAVFLLLMKKTEHHLSCDYSPLMKIPNEYFNWNSSKQIVRGCEKQTDCEAQKTGDGWWVVGVGENMLIRNELALLAELAHTGCHSKILP